MLKDLQGVKVRMHPSRASICRPSRLRLARRSGASFRGLGAGRAGTGAGAGPDRRCPRARRGARGRRQEDLHAGRLRPLRSEDRARHAEPGPRLLDPLRGHRGRGLGQASGNVLLNGKRISGKSTDPATALQAISAKNVTRIEIVDAAQLDVPGLTGQIANVIYTSSSKMSGQFSYRPEFRAHYAHPLFTRGDISISGTRGPIEYTLSFANNASRSSAGGPTLIATGLGDPIEFREDVWTGDYDQPQLSGQFKIDGPGTSLGNVNLLYRRSYYHYDETSLRDRVSTPTRSGF